MLEALTPAERLAGRARRAILFTTLTDGIRPALVDGHPAAVAGVGGEVIPVAVPTIARGRVVVLETSRDPERPARLDITFLDG